jgi:flagellum-specific ATP synthase
MALREAALASGEPPATKGYPPSVFAALPRLVERAGTSSGAGVMTAFYTVLVEGDDLSDPVADATRSLLDGHIVLARNLAERGHYPAIDVLQSVSRLASAVAAPAHMRDTIALREALASYREASDLIQVGAYVAGSDPKVDLAIKLAPKIDGFLKQASDSRFPMKETIATIRELAAQAGVR